ncbi:zona pellucida sperm-binding protein 3-like [Struthio camelus]|uniref:zona pellucida sperm-binding protein 3-like n=1 Tax=Struthio camelus TaxID=8801 RepID=UPI0036042B22
MARGGSQLSGTVLPALLGSSELRLGAGCLVTAINGDRHPLEHPAMELFPDRDARASPVSLPVDCPYPRRDVSSGTSQPTWVPLVSTVSKHRRLRFALELYDSAWSSRLRQPTYSRGDLIHVEASVRAGPRLPLRVFVDECVASPSVASPVMYPIIADNGCLVDGQLGRSRFLSPRRGRSLRFQLDTFVFPNASSSQIYLRCHLKAVAHKAGGESSRACSYDRDTATWHSPDGANCSCCGAPAGCGGRRQRRGAGGRGLLGETSAHLGPLRLLLAWPSSSPEPSTSPEPGTPLLRRPSAPVVRGERRDSGLALPAPGPTLAMVAMGSILAAVGMLGCYCSVRRGRQEGAPDELHGMAMAPTTSGPGNAEPGAPAAPGNPSMV